MLFAAEEIRTTGGGAPGALKAGIAYAGEESLWKEREEREKERREKEEKLLSERNTNTIIKYKSKQKLTFELRMIPNF